MADVTPRILRARLAGRFGASLRDSVNAYWGEALLIGFALLTLAALLALMVL